MSHTATSYLRGLWLLGQQAVGSGTRHHHARRALLQSAITPAAGAPEQYSAEPHGWPIVPLKQHLCHDLRLRPSRVHVVPNGIPAASVTDPGIRQSLGLPEDSQLLLAVGNCSAGQGHKHLIRALRAITVQHPRAHLAIAGRGDLLPELKALAGGLGVGDRVHFLGLRGDVAGLLAAADVFVMPSLSEGLPIAILEAMFAREAHCGFRRRRHQGGAR